MPLPDSFVTVVFDGEPSVLVRPAVFRCYECGGIGCQRCDDRGHVRCSHPALLLTGPSVPFTDGEEWVYTARCAGCGSDVRDIREHAGKDGVDSLKHDVTVHPQDAEVPHTQTPEGAQ